MESGRHFLGRLTVEHAHAIQEGVDIEGVTIEIVENRSEFGKFTSAPESIPSGHVLISFDVPIDKNMELMSQMDKALNPSPN
ncbi:hypothetical protein ACFL2C_02490 [Patescibacteria group bacterium]